MQPIILDFTTTCFDEAMSVIPLNTEGAFEPKPGQKIQLIYRNMGAGVPFLPPELFDFVSSEPHAFINTRDTYTVRSVNASGEVTLTGFNWDADGDDCTEATLTFVVKIAAPDSEQLQNAIAAAKAKAEAEVRAEFTRKALQLQIDEIVGKAEREAPWVAMPDNQSMQQDWIAELSARLRGLREQLSPATDLDLTYSFDNRVLRLSCDLVTLNAVDLAQALIEQVRAELAYYSSHRHQQQLLTTFIAVIEYAIANVMENKHAQQLAGEDINTGNASCAIEQALDAVAASHSLVNVRDVFYAANDELGRQVWRIISGRSHHLSQLKHACVHLAIARCAVNSDASPHLLKLYAALQHTR